MLKQKRSTDLHNKRRHGLHQKKTKPFIQVYWPYMPLLLIVVTGLALSSIWQPYKSGILAYSTDVSTIGLLDNTNKQRQQDGKTILSLNHKLNLAAQAKANDMATRNYWSHTTPEGNEPWMFVEQAGYAYYQAGENLAYGFSGSDDVINGWMNSPTHKANMLESSYQEVGFGFANNDNYQSSGPQTIVVAMYGKPQVAAAATPAQASSPETPAAPPEPIPVVSSPPSSEINLSVPAENNTSEHQNAAVTTLQKPLVEPKAIKVSRVQALTKGEAPWSLLAIGMLSGASICFLLLKHGLRLRRMLVHGEQFILHHTMLDITIIALLALFSVLSQSAGVIR